MARSAEKWKRYLQGYGSQELALLMFCFGSLYLVNPDFIAFQYLRSIKNCIFGAIYSFFMETQLIRVTRGEIKVSSVFSAEIWNTQEVLSLTVTTILLLFFLTNKFLDFRRDWNKTEA